MDFPQRVYMLEFIESEFAYEGGHVLPQELVNHVEVLLYKPIVRVVNDFK